MVPLILVAVLVAALLSMVLAMLLPVWVVVIALGIGIVGFISRSSAPGRRVWSWVVRS